MKYEYDKEVDGLYIWFIDIKKNKSIIEYEVWPQEFKNEIGFLFNNNNKLIGMEFLPASKYFQENVLENIGNKSYR